MTSYMEVNETINTPEARGESPFISAAFTGKNSFWRYFTGVIAPFLAAIIISGLLLKAVIIASSPDGYAMLQKDTMPDFEAMGINLNLGFVLNVFPFLIGLLAFILLVRPLHNRTFGSVINGGRKVI